MTPTTLKIFHRDWQIIWVPTAESTACLDGAAGKWVPGGQIYVGEWLTGQYRAEVILHEVMHAITDSVGIDDDTKEEDVVSRMAVGLVTVFRDNPEFAQWWWKLVK